MSATTTPAPWEAKRNLTSPMYSVVCAAPGPSNRHHLATVYSTARDAVSMAAGPELEAALRAALKALESLMTIARSDLAEALTAHDEGSALLARLDQAVDTLGTLRKPR